MDSYAQNAARRRRQAWISRGVILVIAAGLFFTLFHFFDRATQKPLTPKQKIRAAVEAYLEACRDRDLEEVWDLHTAKIRRLMGPPPPVGSDPHAPLPSDPGTWFPWRIPVSILDRLEIERLERMGDDGAVVELRPDGNERVGARHWRMEFLLDDEGDAWRLGTCSLYLNEDLPAPGPPPVEERETLPDGRRCLTLGFAGKPSADVDELTDPVLALRLDRETTWADLMPVLARAVVSGVEEIRIRPERRIRARRGTWVLFSGIESTTVVSGDRDLGEMVYPVPDQPEIVDLVIGIGRRADVSEQAGALPFESVIGPESSKALAQFTNLLEAPLAKLDLMLSVHPTTDLARIANVWHGLRERGARGIILATENPLGAGYGSALLLNGLRPDQVLRIKDDEIPRVWPDNPVLTRTIARRN